MAEPWPEAVLFDAAGTLIELREQVGDTYARVAAVHGVKLPAWRLGDAFGRVLRRAPPRAFPDAAAASIPDRERGWWRDLVRSTFLAADSTVRFDDFDAFFAELFSQYDGATLWQLRAGAAETLLALRNAEIRLGVVSNFDQRLHGILDALGIAALLETVVLPADCGCEKPDRRIFEVALDRLGCSAARTVYVGDDTEKDTNGARLAGLVAIDLADLGPLEALPARLQSLATLRNRPAAHEEPRPNE